MRLPRPALLLITDRGQARRPLEEVIAAALAGGCRWISLREKDLPAGERHVLLRRLLPLARRHGAILTVHADLDAAREADGVHLPAGAPVGAARAALGPTALVGASAHSLAEIMTAADEGADYATLSPIFLTDSKPGYGPAVGLGALAAAARAAPIPIVALGGIGPENLRACLDAGATGVAVMGGMMRADDPAALMRRLIGLCTTRSGQAAV